MNFRQNITAPVQIFTIHRSVQLWALNTNSTGTVGATTIVRSNTATQNATDLR